MKAVANKELQFRIDSWWIRKPEGYHLMAGIPCVIKKVEVCKYCDFERYSRGCCKLRYTYVYKDNPEEFERCQCDFENNVLPYARGD